MIMIKSKKLTLESLDALHKELEQTDRSNGQRIIVSGGTCSNVHEGLELVESLKTNIEKHFSSDQVDLRVTGCLGYCEFEPVVLIRPGEIFYQGVKPGDAEDIVNGTVKNGKVVKNLLHRSNGNIYKTIDEIPFYKKQKRLIFGNNFEISPWNIEDYIAIGGYSALSKALSSMTPDEVIEEIKLSGLRGRGGAGFPTGVKWGFVRKAPGDQKFVLCNADEGDPGAYMDRSLMEGNPHCVLEGMLIGAYALGADKGYVYIRNEYPLALKIICHAINEARAYGLLGSNILGKDFNLTINVNRGAGAFVCGEETALIASLEGKVGTPRPRPPFPAISGLWGKPTTLNNVETFANVTLIINKGSDWYRKIGSENSKGTKIFSLVGKVVNTGLVEVPMGITLGELVYEVGGGIRGGKKLKAVQTGGPSGGCIPRRLMNTSVDYDSLVELGAIMGSGGLIVMDEDTCMVDLTRYFLDFLKGESCGKCAPCREGVRRMHQIVELICQGKAVLEDLVVLEELAGVVKGASLCGLGQTAPNPVLSTLKYFREEYDAHIIDKRCPAGVCKALVSSPCCAECPAEVNVPIYVAHIANGEYDEALAVHREANPFPAICGRVCPAFCESKCRRGKLDETVAIRTLKRFMADQEKEQWKPSIVVKDYKEQSIAIVGAGPAGLTAALRLAQQGYQVTIFEAEPVLGGWMILGIPDYRLPKDLIKREIESITNMENVEVKINTKVGRDVPIDTLRREYDAVILAVGAMKSRGLSIAGEESEGVVHGIDFLKALNLGEDVSYVKGKRAAIIGGGNIAIDAARSLIRLGADEVSIVYRRRREDMTALEGEIEAAEEEGVKFMFLLMPIEVLSEACPQAEQKNSKMNGLLCQRMRLEDEYKRPDFDSSGRKRPFPIEDEKVVLKVDMLILAIGQEVDPSFLDGSKSVFVVARGGSITAEERTFDMHEEGVFAVGDAVIGPSSVIEAVAHGNKVAKVIQRYLQGEWLRTEHSTLRPPAEILKRPPEGVGEFVMAEEDGLRPRQKESVLSPEVRKDNTREVELGFTSETIAKAEARRCLRCDLEPL